MNNYRKMNRGAYQRLIADRPSIGGRYTWVEQLVGAEYRRVQVYSHGVGYIQITTL